MTLALRIHVFLLVVLFGSATQANAEVSVSLNLDRSSYYRGEEALAVVSAVNRGEVTVENASLTLSASGVLLGTFPLPGLPSLGGATRTFRVPTHFLKVGAYEVEAAAIDTSGALAKTARDIVLAKRPNPDRLLVWLWGGGGNDWYLDHGFTSWSGPYWRGEGVEFADATLKRIEKGLVAGADVGLTANGGLRDIEPEQFEDPTAAHPNVRETHKGKIANPHHPEVARLQDRINRRLMERVKGYPQIKTAFFNTEVIDNLRTDTTPEGRARMKAALGFTDEEVGERAQFVAPGVLADDDRKYLLHKYRYKQGNGLALANRRTADMIHRYRPDIATINDPYRETALYDMFPGLDVISTWTYTNPDPKLMLYIETLRAACKPGGQTPMQTVTLLNYPGELAPTEEWMLMGPGRAKVVTWINLSRAPTMLGYYFSSACNPVDADSFAVPYSTSLAIRELSEKVFIPYGPLLSNIEVSPRRIAVLSSAAARVHGKSPRLRGSYANYQPYHFYTVLAMAQYQADVVFDETIERYGLDDYDVLCLPKCDVLTESVYNEIREFQARGGIVLTDQYLGAEIPGAIRFDFDFTYRAKVSAQAIAKNTVTAEWNDHIDPASVELETVVGVTALDDQRIMESYAKELGARLDGIVPHSITADAPTVLLNTLEKGSAKYLVAVNDKRTYDDRVGKFKGVLGKILPQTATIAIRDWDSPNLHVYDLLERKALPISKTNNGYEFPLELTELGGKILALRSSPLESMAIEIPESPAKVGESARVTVRIKQGDGADAVGVLPVRVTLTDPNGDENELTDFYRADEGRLLLDFTPALNDARGTWKLRAEDLTAGLETEMALTVVD